ncbi:MAG TPA: AMP-binding protein [Sandaracinaceae bacterium LLY-WYZ-13_1]|nr:AMP-binding protein [Sandaracinaceae bacterium LLY-WYZ-13_1]
MTELSQWTRRLRAVGRIAFRSGAAFQARPAAAVEALRMRLAGPLGLPSLIRVHAAARPDAPAIVFEDRTRTWRELDARIDRLASGLRRRHGIGRGDAGVLIMHNRPEFLEAQAALARLGGSAVSVSWRSTADELEYLVGHSGAKVVLAEAAVADAVDEARGRLATVPAANLIAVAGEREGFASYDALLAQAPAERVDGREGSVVIYTSGTTGKPKGAVREFPKEMAWAVIHVLDELPIRADDRHLAVCPMYHSTAFGFIGFTMVLGGSVVIEPRFDPERFLAAIERHRITTTAVVPTMLHRVLDLPESVRRRYDTRSLHAIFCGGAPLSGTLARRVIGELGHVLYNFYGSTETGLNTLATPEELLLSPGTIGHPIEGNEIRLLDERGREVADGDTGELWVKNAMLVAGYHRDEAATRSSMRDGFFSVGDLAHRDENGLFHIDGRKRDMIISGGVNVYPAEVEEILHRHPRVAEVAVVGVPDEEWGERVRACVVPDGELDEAELLTWGREQLSGPKAPREVRLLDALPKNPTGKVLKRQLRS